MTLLERRLRAVRWRLEWLNFARRFVRLILAALIALAVCVTAAKFVRLPVALDAIALWLAGATIPLALLWAIATRTTLHHAAVAADEKMALRERLSSALSLGVARTPMEAAVAADAESHAQPIRARRVFPMPLWRDLYYMPIPVIVMALVGWLVPAMDLTGKKNDQADAVLPTLSQQEMAKRLDAFQRELEKAARVASPVAVREISSEMERMVRDLQSQKLSRTDVLKSLSKLSDRVAERKEGLEKKMASAQQLERFRSGEMTRKIAEAAAKGNFDQAKAEMDKLSGQLKQDALSKDQLGKLASEMKGLSDALKDNPELSEALAKAAQSLSGGDAGKAASDLQLSAQQLQSLAETLKQMAELDQIEKYLQALQAGQCCGCGCSTCTACSNCAAMLAMMAQFREGDNENLGPGMGGPGRGMGGIPQFKETPTQFQPSKARMKLDKGDIIGVVKVWGPQVKGEASAKFEQTYLEYRQSAEDSMTRENIPLEYRTLVRDYFDAIRPNTEKQF